MEHVRANIARRSQGWGDRGWSVGDQFDWGPDHPVRFLSSASPSDLPRASDGLRTFHAVLDHRI